MLRERFRRRLEVGLPERTRRVSDLAAATGRVLAGLRATDTTPWRLVMHADGSLPFEGAQRLRLIQGAR